MTVDEIHEVSKIDHWFLRRLERIAKFSKKLQVRTASGLVCHLGFVVPCFDHQSGREDDGQTSLPSQAHTLTGVCSRINLALQP